MRNVNLYKKFLKLTIKNSEQKVIKQFIIAFVATLMLCVLSNYNTYLFKLLIVGYLIFCSFIVGIENNVFLTAYDILLFNIKKYDSKFFVIYLIQRIFRDTYIFNIFVFIVLLIYLIIFNFEITVWLIFTVFINYLILPLEHICLYGFKGKIIVNVIIKLCFVSVLIIGYFNSYLILNSNLYYVVLGFYLLMLLLNAYIFKEKKRREKNFLPIFKKYIKISKLVNIYVYKDILMNYKNLLISLVSSLAFLALIGVSRKQIYSSLALCFFIDSFLSAKNENKQYKLTFGDPLFWNDNYCKIDKLKIRKSKLYTILTVNNIKIIIALLILILFSAFDYNQFIILIILSYILCINDYLIICKNMKIPLILYKVSNYILVLTYVCITFLSNNSLSLVITLPFMIILIGTLICLYAYFKEVNYAK